MESHVFLASLVCFCLVSYVNCDEAAHQQSGDLIGRLMDTIQRLESRVKELETSAIYGQKEREDMRARFEDLSEKCDTEHSGIAKRKFKNIFINFFLPSKNMFCYLINIDEP